MRATGRQALTLIESHRATYLFLNLAFYGLVVLGTIYSLVNPSTQGELTRSIVEGFNVPPLSLARDAYVSGNVPAAALVTFLVNSVFGAFVTITVPSLLIPFFGTFMGFYRALLWGVALAPSSPQLATAMVPHSITLLLEGQGYILAMFGVHLLWSSAFAGLRRPGVGFGKGYREGLRRNLPIYGLVLSVLAVAAVYEALELILVVGRL